MNRYAVIAILLLCSAVTFQTRVTHAQPTLEDIQYKTACGPIACFAALKTLGVETTLPEVVQKCEWKQDVFVPLTAMQSALKSYRGIDCQMVQLSPKELVGLLNDERTVVILAMRKTTDDVDHAVCAVGTEQNGQVVKMIDYPELVRRQLIGELADKWDGAALVVRISPLHRACEDFALWFGPFVAAFLCFAWFRNRRNTGAKS